MTDREHLYCLLAFQNGFVSHDMAKGVIERLDSESDQVESSPHEALELSDEDVSRVQQILDCVLDRYEQDASLAVRALQEQKAASRLLDRSLHDTDQDDRNMSTNGDGSGSGSGPESLETIAYDPMSMSAAGQGIQENRFRILREHARGGLGVVHLAEDEQFSRQVALKQIRTDRADDAAHRVKFLHEAQVTGQLEHPGIVPIYSMGSDQLGRPFYAMRFIQGESLASAISELRKQDIHQGQPTDNPRLRQLLRRLIDVCNAMAYAHDQKILHRDLKPANVMLGKYGETLVVDWGLAKTLRSKATEPDSTEAASHQANGDSNLETVQGQFLGTIAYASPEQLMGNIDQLSSRSDVYSLGAILYEMLTGQPPLKNARSREDALTQLKSLTERSWSASESRIPKALAAICDKAMSWNPEDRYANSTALADDLESWLDDRAVTAYKDPLIHAAFRWARKNQAKATACLVGGLALIVLVSGYSVVKSDAARRVASADAAAAKSQAEAIQSESAADLARAAKDEAERRGLRDQVDKFEARGDLQGAIETLEKLRAMNNALTDVQAINLAEKYFLDQQSTRAREVLEKLDEASLPSDLLARRDMILGDVLYGTTKEDQGLALLRRSLESNQLDDADAAYVRGVVALTAEECIRELSNCLYLDPQNSMARVRLAMTQMIVGEPRKAIENARLGKLLAPEDWRFNIAIAFSHASMVDEESMEAELESVVGIPEAVPLANFCRLMHDMSSFLDSKFERIQPQMNFTDVLAISKMLGQVMTSIVPAVVVSQQADGLTIPRLGWVGEMHRRMGSPSLEPMQLTIWLTRLSAMDDLGPTINELAELMPNSRLVQSFQMINEISSRTFEEALEILREIDETEPTLPGLDLNFAVWTSLTLANQEVHLASNKKTRLQQIQDIQPWAEMLRKRFSEREFIASEEVGVAIAWGVLLKNGFLIEALDVAKSQVENTAYPEDVKARWIARFELTEELQEAYETRIQDFVKEATKDPRFIIIPPAPAATSRSDSVQLR